MVQRRKRQFCRKKVLSKLEHWSVSGGKSIMRTFTFKDFKEALEFVNKVGDLAELHNHHPDIHLVEYKKVKIVLTTHSVGGITEKDITLAKEIDKFSA